MCVCVCLSITRAPRSFETYDPRELESRPGLRVVEIERFKFLASFQLQARRV